MIQRKTSNHVPLKPFLLFSVFESLEIAFIVLFVLLSLAFLRGLFSILSTFFPCLHELIITLADFLFLLNTRSKLIIKLNSVILTNLILKSTGYFKAKSEGHLSMTQLGMKRCP